MLNTYRTVVNFQQLKNKCSHWNEVKYVNAIYIHIAWVACVIDEVTDKMTVTKDSAYDIHRFCIHSFNILLITALYPDLSWDCLWGDMSQRPLTENTVESVVF